MSAAHLEELRKRYNFKQISVATWRDPRQSVLPARGGPKQTSIPAGSAGAPYMPTYKVSYMRPKPPEPTDDEDSPGEEGADEELVEEFVQLPAEETADSEEDQEKDTEIDRMWFSV